ncbi:MAG: glucose-6-phosphate dehydrogenase [Waddliaceae bacterium]|nr:glucose-6-phosphate dehydrogenase [Waddliaceae bacterium]
MIQTTMFKNPLAEEFRSAKTAEPCILVIFGASGDLTARKLMPAVYNLAREGQLPSHFACVGFARREKENDVFRQEMHDAVSEHSRVKPVDPEMWESFSQQLFYHQAPFDSDEGYKELKIYLDRLDQQLHTKGNRVFYLSTQPSYFCDIIGKLKTHGLIYDSSESSKRWSRVIIEKPFGHDFTSARALHSNISSYLDESQIYRIDHYLGKETVQNLLVFRFSNSIFESLWNNRHIDHVQITVGEDLGIGSRGRFWEEAGMLRDIVQNHMMQLLSLMAMEPPVSLKADAIRDEKVKVLQAIRPFQLDDIHQYFARGQYGEGYINGSPVPAYRSEGNVAENSVVETYAAMQLYIDNWRWAGVPFYLRGGKRLPKRATEIAIYFKEAPGVLFPQSHRKTASNILVIRIQPDEGISLKLNCKVPGLSSQIQPVKMDFRYGSYFGATPPEAYERLICDCILGDSTLFARSDEVLNSWELLTPLLECWRNDPPSNFPNYSAGTWGPAEADLMLSRQGRAWRLM